MRRVGPIALLVLAAAAPAEAQSEHGSRAEWRIAAGYGASVHLNSGRSDEHLLLVEPQLGYQLGRHFEYLAEAHLAAYATPQGYMLGLLPLGARYLPVTGEIAPYLSVGAGFGWTDLTELEEIDRRFNFLLQAGLGVRRKLVGGGAWSLEVRLAHVSNGGTKLPNLGLNSVVVLMGWRIR